MIRDITGHATLEMVQRDSHMKEKLEEPVRDATRPVYGIPLQEGSALYILSKKFLVGVCLNTVSILHLFSSAWWDRASQAIVEACVWSTSPPNEVLIRESPDGLNLSRFGGAKAELSEADEVVRRSRSADHGIVLAPASDINTHLATV